MTDGELVRNVGESEVELRFTSSPPVWFSRLPVHDCVLYECFLSLGCVCGGTRKDFCLYRWVVIKLIPVQMSYLCILYYNYHYICVFCTIIITNNVCEQKVLVLRQLQNEGHFLPSFFFLSQPPVHYGMCQATLLIFFTTVLSHWEFSHGKFGLLSLGKASSDSRSI